VNSLYAVLRNAQSGLPSAIGDAGGGGTKHYPNCSSRSGLTPGSPFWDGGLSVISGMIDELEGWADCDRSTKGLVMGADTNFGSRRVHDRAPRWRRQSGVTHDRHADATRCTWSGSSRPVHCSGSIVASLRLRFPHARMHDGDEATLRLTEGPFFKRLARAAELLEEQVWRAANRTGCFVLSRACKPLAGAYWILQADDKGRMTILASACAAISFPTWKGAIDAQHRARRLCCVRPYPCEGAAARRPCADHPALFPGESQNRSDGLFRASCSCALPKTRDGSPGFRLRARLGSSGKLPRRRKSFR